MADTARKPPPIFLACALGNPQRSCLFKAEPRPTRALARPIPRRSDAAWTPSRHTPFAGQPSVVIVDLATVVINRRRETPPRASTRRAGAPPMVSITGSLLEHRCPWREPAAQAPSPAALLRFRPPRLVFRAGEHLHLLPMVSSLFPNPVELLDAWVADDWSHQSCPSASI
jgi:hypothetical protein